MSEEQTMPDQQFENDQQRERDISEEKTEKRYYGEKSISEDQQSHAGDISEEKTEKRRPDEQQSISEGYIEEHQDGEQHEVQPDRVNEQLGQTSRPGFLRLLLDQYKEFVAATCFLSILPLPSKVTLFRDDEGEPQLNIGSAYFPLVGLLIALIACLLPFLIGPNLHLPPLVLAALLTVVLIWLTGGLHLDGLMDTSDALFAVRGREHKLEIMRDSRIGAFGVLGGVSILLLKFAIFASLDPHRLTLALLMVVPIARWAMVLVISLFPSARPGGLGASARQMITPSRLLIAAIISLLIALGVGQLIGFALIGLAVWMAGSLVAIIIGMWIAYVLGGLTGDVYGAIAEMTEVACLLMLAVTVG